MTKDAHTEPLFFEDIEDALRYVVQCMGGAKVVGAKVRPEMDPDKAGRWLADCLNDLRREHLAPQQVLMVLRMARQAGIHAAMRHINGECGYADPTPIEPEDEIARLQREYVEATKTLGALVTRIESAQSQIQSLRRVI